MSYVISSPFDFFESFSFFRVEFITALIKMNNNYILFFKDLIN